MLYQKDSMPSQFDRLSIIDRCLANPNDYHNLIKQLYELTINRAAKPDNERYILDERIAQVQVKLGQEVSTGC
jgi:hypothetical protein